MRLALQCVASATPWTNIHPYCMSLNGSGTCRANGSTRLLDGGGWRVCRTPFAHVTCRPVRVSAGELQTERCSDPGELGQTLMGSRTLQGNSRPTPRYTEHGWSTNWTTSPIWHHETVPLSAPRRADTVPCGAGARHGLVRTPWAADGVPGASRERLRSRTHRTGLLRVRTRRRRWWWSDRLATGRFRCNRTSVSGDH